MEIPKISVIIPLYNAEKYIGECLDSLIAQTLQDFEVIVVDDCSTDNSVEIVQNYAEKFGGRLKISRTQKNSGGCAVPRNVGLNFSRGEYISFLDTDDAFTTTALEELYLIAKKFDADVVCCEKYYDVPEKIWYDAELRKKIKPFSYQSGEFVTEPTLISDDLYERVKACYEHRFLWNVWSKLVRRDLIFENEFVFADTLIEDVIFTICLACVAKKFIRVPNVVNYYREREISVSNIPLTDNNYFLKYIRALTSAFRYLDEFLSSREFFNQHSDIKYLALETCHQEILRYLQKIYAQEPVQAFDELLRQEFSKGNNIALAAFIFGAMNVYNLKLTLALQRVDELEKINRQDKAYIAELEKFVANLYQGAEKF